ncbi:Holliday junction branch migration protein RuvA [Cryptosporangium japonicum]|uniref:Holliday junction branch migration complex subunit RuvA n=1 Tax=Cryptosporangium japonicum TaxID=80872 RepID=A0ABN0V3U8_9ACTN
MIASVRGDVAAVGPDGAVVEVGGVGIAVHCTPATLSGLRVGSPTRLATSLVVREDSLTLYGFATDDERMIFELLQTASGVGPRLALAVLAVHSPDAVRVAIASADTAALTRVSGIGKKGAERLVLELRDKIGSVDPVAVPGLAPAGGWPEAVREGLTGLGWSAKEAEDAVGIVAADFEGRPVEVAAALRRAIQVLGKNR